MRHNEGHDQTVVVTFEFRQGDIEVERSLATFEFAQGVGAFQGIDNLIFPFLQARFNIC